MTTKIVCMVQLLLLVLLNVPSALPLFGQESPNERNSANVGQMIYLPLIENNAATIDAAEETLIEEFVTREEIQEDATEDELESDQTLVQASAVNGIAVDLVSDPQTTGYPDSRKIVRDNAGNLYLAYRKKATDGNLHIFVARLAAGSSTFANTGQSVETTPVPSTQRVPSLTIDENNNLHVVWYGPDANSAGPNDRQIRYTRSQGTSGGEITWTPVMTPAIIPGYATITPPPTLWQEHPVIFAAPKQRLYVAWEGKDVNYPQKAQIKWIRSRDGGATWSAWQNIPGDANLYYSRPTILGNPDGRKLYVLAYATALNGTAQLVWTQSLDNDSDPGDAWDKWRYVADTNGDGASDSTQDQRHLSVAMDSKKRLHLVWRQKPEGSPSTAKTQIHYATYPQNGRWSPVTSLLPNLQANQAFPSITVDKDDRLWAAWSESPDLPNFPNEDLVTGEIRAAKKPSGKKWQPIATPVLSAGSRAFYPTLRWHRYGSKPGVDLAWVESSITDPANNTCMEGGQVKCMINYTNLAGQ